MIMIDTPEGPIPAPDEWHPYYEGSAIEVRAAISHWLVSADFMARPLRLRPPVRFRVRAAAEALVPTAVDVLDPILLDGVRLWGPAPYVGDPFAYVWPAARDLYGRWVAGPSRRVYVRESQ